MPRLLRGADFGVPSLSKVLSDTKVRGRSLDAMPIEPSRAKIDNRHQAFKEICRVPGENTKTCHKATYLTRMSTHVTYRLMDMDMYGQILHPSFSPQILTPASYSMDDAGSPPININTYLPSPVWLASASAGGLVRHARHLWSNLMHTRAGRRCRVCRVRYERNGCRCCHAAIHATCP